MKKTKKWYSVTEFAEAVNMTRQGVHRRINSGLLPAQKIGSTYVVRGDFIAMTHKQVRA